MQRYTPRDIVVLVAIAALFIWSYSRTRGQTWEEFALSLVALVVAVTFHECAHATVALMLGDPTAKLLGRVSLNPIRHLDLWGSLTFLFIGFGWGKPVPVNGHNMRRVSPLVGYAISALAGPASNVLLAFIATLPLRFVSAQSAFVDPLVFEFLQALLFVNIGLAAFNFLPIPPLDGFSLARLVLPPKVSDFLSQYGMFILIALVFLPQFFGRQFDFLTLVMRPLQSVIFQLVTFGLR
ncbi:MAG: site-2 protease family protein [Chloroflexi bacterium]|nr:site-2 protease family protein [Chloroflexota bacterium]